MIRQALPKIVHLAAVLSLLACVPPPTEGSNAGQAEVGVAAATPAATAEGSADSCAALSSQICEQAGPQSAACTSVQKTATLLSPATCDVALADIAYTMQKVAEAGAGCADLAKRLCKDLGPDTATCKMVEEQTPQIPAEQCESMSENYDKVLADLQRMEEKNKPLPADKVAKMTGGENVPSYGLADSKVTVVEFSDFECPYCSRSATAINEIKDQYGDRVRFVFRQFPLSFHQQAHLAGQASLAANAQGKFWEFHDKLFANQKALSRADLEKYAEELGLDMAAFKQALDEGTYKDTVDAELALGQEVFVEGTPTVFVNGERVGNATDAASISSAIDKALGS